jgi:hypothetical protein
MRRHVRCSFPVERDIHFDADKALSTFAGESRECGRIVT